MSKPQDKMVHSTYCSLVKHAICHQPKEQNIHASKCESACTGVISGIGLIVIINGSQSTTPRLRTTFTVVNYISRYLFQNNSKLQMINAKTTLSLYGHTHTDPKLCIYTTLNPQNNLKYCYVTYTHTQSCEVFLSSWIKSNYHHHHSSLHNNHLYKHSYRYHYNHYHQHHSITILFFTALLTEHPKFFSVAKQKQMKGIEHG